MSGSSTISNELFCSENESAIDDVNSTDTRIITFYEDLGNEVDVHFARALSSESNGSNSQSISTPLNEIGSNLPSSLSLSRSPSPVPKQSSQPQIPLSQAVSSTDVSSLSPRPTSPSGSTTPSFVTKRKKPSVIIYPELASFLIHPDVDSFSDAPRVPGQPSSTRTIPSYIDYIPSISFTYQTTSLPQYTQLINQPHQGIMDFTQTNTPLTHFNEPAPINQTNHSLIPPNGTEYPPHPINITQYTSLYQPHYYTLPGPSIYNSTNTSTYLSPATSLHYDDINGHLVQSTQSLPLTTSSFEVTNQDLHHILRL